MNNINKCPKCGNTPKVYGWVNMYSGHMRDVKISCEQCDIQTKRYGTHEDAVDEWNSITDNYPNNQNTVHEK
jgi:predicted nucleic-acid-binding Zn-ribbon protein